MVLPDGSAMQEPRGNLGQPSREVVLPGAAAARLYPATQRAHARVDCRATVGHRAQYGNFPCSPRTRCGRSGKLGFRHLLFSASTPTASPNAVAVKDQIVSLQIKVEGTIQSLLDQAKNISPKLSTTSNWGYSDQLQALDDLAKMKVRIGDVDGAKQIALTCKQPVTFQSKNFDESFASECLLHIVTVQAQLGDFDEARATADQAAQAEASRVMNDDMMQYGRPDQNSIAQAARGTNYQAYSSIISYEAKAGKIQNAIKDLAAHPGLAEPSSANAGNNLLVDIAEAQYRAGQEQAARQTLNRAADNIEQYAKKLKEWKTGPVTSTDTDTPYEMLALAQLDIDDIEGALKTISFLSPTIRDVYLNGSRSNQWALDDAYIRRALLQWKKGDLDAASTAVSHIYEKRGAFIYGWRSGDLRATNVLVEGQDSRGKDYCLCQKADLLRLIQARADGSELSLSAPSQSVNAVDAWTNLLSYSLNGPLFTDLHYQLQVISAQNTPKAIFVGLLKATQQMNDASEKIKQTEADLAK